MKIQNLKIKLIAPVLLLVPMACMHFGDDHHSGGHHSMLMQQSLRSVIHDKVDEDMIGFGGMVTHQADRDSRNQGHTTPPRDR